MLFRPIDFSVRMCPSTLWRCLNPVLHDCRTMSPVFSCILGSACGLLNYQIQDGVLDFETPLLLFCVRATSCFVTDHSRFVNACVCLRKSINQYNFVKVLGMHAGDRWRPSQLDGGQAAWPVLEECIG